MPFFDNPFLVGSNCSSLSSIEAVLGVTRVDCLDRCFVVIDSSSFSGSQLKNPRAFE
jgi:hypothetical protein